MICKCGMERTETWNYCTHCAGANPDRDIRKYEDNLKDLITCNNCGREIDFADSYCCNCREPNRFRIAKLVYLLAEKANVEDCDDMAWEINQLRKLNDTVHGIIHDLSFHAVGDSGYYELSCDDFGIINKVCLSLKRR